MTTSTKDQSSEVGRDAHDVRWDTEDSNNGDSYDGKPAWNAGNSSVGMRFCCRGNGW